MSENLKAKFEIGDTVLIIGCPKTTSSYSNQDYELALNTIGKIAHIYKHGERNIVVRWGKYNAINYYSASHLLAQPPVSR